MDFIAAIFSQVILFVPFALGVCISYNFLKATDMTLDGSYVLGAGVFAKCIILGIAPVLAFPIALLGGTSAGLLVGLIQRKGQIEPLLAGVLATFILMSVNLVLMGRPNINLLGEHTLVSNAFAVSHFAGFALVSLYVVAFCGICIAVLHSRLGVLLRALGDNPNLLQKITSVEKYRLIGFAFTNTLAAASGALTSQVIGFADTGMGLGMTLTAIGAVILGQQLLKSLSKTYTFNISFELIASLLGVIVYFTVMNGLLRMDIEPIYLKILMGLMLIVFIRASGQVKRLTC